jgi:small subunit ribosomal protein S2
MTTTKNDTQINLDELFKHGVHFGFARGRRHPSVKNYIYGSKNKNDVFDLEKTNEKLEAALEFVSKLGEEKGQILLVGGKSEAREAVRMAGEATGLPFVAGRWIGGTLTNFPEIKKRIAKMLDLKSQREKGELAKYTKKERLLIDREIAKLETFFSGLIPMQNLPKAIFVVDARFEITAVREAKRLKIPVIGLCSTDNDIKTVDYPILGNDSSRTSVKYIVNLVQKAYTK